MKLAVVTASVDPEKTRQYWSSWREKARGKVDWIMVWSPPEKPAVLGSGQLPFDTIVTMHEGIVGVVPAFAAGVVAAVERGADVICCFHDDLRIHKEGWDLEVLWHFDRHPLCGLAGFSGADGLGDSDIYQKPYEPHQLARVGFFSMLDDAEAHGRREPMRRRSACCDGFSLIGRAGFMQQGWRVLENLGVIHHAYDSWFGAHAQRMDWECWYLPIASHHAGGVTAVGSEAYQKWAAERGGDQAIWEQAHRLVYDDLRGVLPIRVKS